MIEDIAYLNSCVLPRNTSKNELQRSIENHEFTLNSLDVIALIFKLLNFALVLIQIL